MTPVVFTDLDDLLGAAPAGLGTTDWVTISEQDLTGFAAATGVGASPYFTLALTNRFLPDLIAVPAASSGVNYGADAVRFGIALRSGDRVRASASLLQASAVAGGVQTTVEVRVEVEGRPDPACVARSLSRWLR